MMDRDAAVERSASVWRCDVVARCCLEGERSVSHRSPLVKVDSDKRTDSFATEISSVRVLRLPMYFSSEWKMRMS